MDKDATQTGADSDQLAPAHAARSAVMQQIVARVNEEYAPDLAGFNEETGQVEAKEPEKQQEEPAKEPEQTQETPEPPKKEEDLETLVVEGREIQVKRDQVLDAGRRALQKESAADKRLQEATEMFRRAQAYEASLRQRQPSSDAGEDQSPSSDATNGSGQQTRQATPDIGTLVDERLWMHDATKAAQRFKEEFKDIVDDPFAARLVARLEDERLAQAAATGSPLGDPWDAYRKHGETIREWLGKNKPQGQPAASEDRQERKRSTVAVTGASTRLQPPAPQKPPTTTEIIERQRQARLRGRQIQPSR